MALSEGSQIGHYRILGVLGSGGMGEVYHARDTRLHREVALKVLPEHVATSPEALSRFEREAITLAQLSHPNILGIHDFGRYGGVTLAVTEFLAGETLRRRMERSEVPPRDALTIGSKISEGLAAAHSKGIVHRDLKPENIYLTQDQQVKILDFGLARTHFERQLDEETNSFLPSETDPGVIKGTIGYMSPEQLRGEEVDSRSDIFSLGCVLYEMLTGRGPFKRKTVADTMTAILQDEPPDFRESGRHLPPETEKVTSRCLEKDPSHRYQSCQDLSLHLTSLATNPDLVLPEYRSRRNRWKPAGWISLAVVLLASVLLSLLFVPEQESTLPPLTQPHLAILFFENNTGDDSLDWLRTALTNMLVTDLSQSAELNVVPTDKLYQILSELDALDTPNFSSDIVQEVARRGGADVVLLGDFVRAGDLFRLNVRLQEAKSGTILATEKVEGSGEGSIFEMVDVMTRRIRDALAVNLPEQNRGIESVTTSSVEAYRNYVKGNELHIRSLGEEALPYLERAVELDPNFAMALAKLSVVHWNLGHVEASYDFARRALERAERLPARERYYIEGRYYSLNPETLDRAIEAYEEALRRYPSHGAARHNLAALYLELERYEDAITHFEVLLSGRDSFSGTYSNLAKAYALSGDAEAGYEVLLQFLERTSEEFVAYRNLGSYLILVGRLEDASEALQRAEILAPGDPITRGEQWRLAVLLEDWPRALQIAHLLRDRDDPHWRHRGMMLSGLTDLYHGRIQEALSSFQAARAVFPGENPFRAQALITEAQLHFDLGDFNQALTLLHEAYDAGQSYPIVQEVLKWGCWVEAARGDSDKGLAVFEELRSRLDTLPAKLISRHENVVLGGMALLENHPEEAVARFQEALSTIPSERSPRYQGGRLYLRLGSAYLQLIDDQKAYESLKTFLEGRVQNLSDPVALTRGLYYSGVAARNLGRDEEARSFFERFLKAWGGSEMDRAYQREAREFLER